MKTNNTLTTMNANAITLTPESVAHYNAMLTPTEEPASLSWDGETLTNDELTALGVEAFGGNDAATETTAPEFSELSHAATNIVLTAENDGNIYRRHVLPLILSLVNKIKRGIKPDRKRLAQSAAMRAIIADSLAEMYCAGWMEDNAKVKATERKEAANYLAWSYISDAKDEYSNQMAAYK